MLRVLDNSQTRPEAGADAADPDQRARPVRLLLVHNGDARLAALDSLLGGLGYDATVLATADEARAWLDNAGPPDALITTLDLAGPLRGLVFGRECLARYPSMQALYVTWMPWPAAWPLVVGERMLLAPFTAAHLAAAIATRPTPPRKGHR